ncbi:hypothetical protein L207DRAFT_514869 [Hyaloscypha variabilis F]|uniref:Uncharacterized protein n=1 Tax=Hyaloscypha variabilis (strain UAMH 11265 / GT02V1 / F) TaxID=1149755 RepID=A0A2J6RGL3_HYAVF|nr:hypothetical protein L207DRAFT_514869 [Hyaloscypha variabilis F]
MATDTKISNVDKPQTSEIPDPKIFTEYLSEMKSRNHFSRNKDKTKASQHFTLASAPDVPVYAIKVRGITHGLPHIELHSGQDLNAPITAVGRICLRNHGFGLPIRLDELIRENAHVATKDGIGEELMTWENLNRVTRWSEKVYGFEWGVGSERKSYTWLRTKPMGMRNGLDMKELELRVGGREEAENGGECVAKWVKGKGFKTLKKGSLFVKKGGGDERWESVVMITFLMILEIFVRKGGG